MKIQNTQENEPIIIGLPLLTGAATMISFSTDEYGRKNPELSNSLNSIYLVTIVDEKTKMSRWTPWKHLF